MVCCHCGLASWSILWLVSLGILSTFSSNNSSHHRGTVSPLVIKVSGSVYHSASSRSAAEEAFAQAEADGMVQTLSR